MFGPLSLEENSRISALPVINRARGSRLYAANGSRWIDCWADGGRALMGHRPGKVSLRLKSEIDRGLYAPYPNRWTQRLEKALLLLFPAYKTVRIFRDMERALTVTGKKDWPLDPLDFPEGTSTERHHALWGRPFLPNHPLGEFLFPILPLPGFTEVQVLLIARDEGHLPPSDLVSPLILAALTRACHTLRNGSNRACASGSDIWMMRGPYMVYRGNFEDYTQVFDCLFKKSVLIAPSPHRPSVYPLDISPGEKRLLDIP